MGFKKAVKGSRPLRMALIGVSGSGKTWTALTIATALGESIALIDTEKGSASMYAEEFDFDALDLTNHDPRAYVKAIELAASEGYEVLVIDSLSHAWMGQGGALEQVDAIASRNRGNTFTAWRTVTPMHNALVTALLDYPGHVIVTMRQKADHVVEQKNGKATPRKVGMAAIQRDGLEYEFDVIAEMDIEHILTVTKTRLRALDGVREHCPDETFGVRIKQAIGKTEPPPQRFGEETQANIDAIAASYLSAFKREGFSPADACTHHLEELMSRAGELFEGEKEAAATFKKLLETYRGTARKLTLAHVASAAAELDHVVLPRLRHERGGVA